MKVTGTARILLSIILIVASFGLHQLAIRSFAQAKNESARKIDEYGDLIQEDEAARLDAFETELRRVPDSRAYIIAYGGRHDPVGKAQRYAQRAKVYLVKARAMASSRVVPVDGGRRENLAIELWLVPASVQAPAPTPTVTVEQPEGGKAMKYDEYSYGYEASWNSYEVPSVRLNGFGAALRNQPGAQGYIVVYALNGDDRRAIQRDPPGRARKIANDERINLIKNAGIAPSRIIAVDGGYSDQRTVVLWVVPPGARPPAVRSSRSGKA